MADTEKTVGVKRRTRIARGAPSLTGAGLAREILGRALLGRALLGRAILGGVLLLSGALLLAGPARAGERMIMLRVENMACATCPAALRRALERVPGVAAVSVSRDAKTAWVTFDSDRTDPAALTAATAKAGFPSSPRGVGSHRGTQGENR